MKFSFKNIGVVQEANIEVNGLTVIAGLNDTGKSFISKAIYSIIKTIKETSKQERFEKFELLRRQFNLIFQHHRMCVPFNVQRQKDFNPNNPILRISDLLRTGAPSSDLVDVFTEYKNNAIRDIYENLHISMKESAESYVHKINEIYFAALPIFNEEVEEEKQYKKFFDKYIIGSFFKNQLNSIYRSAPTKIEMSEGVNKLLEVTIRDNKTEQFALSDQIFITDATIIETPTIIQLAKFIKDTLAFPSFSNEAEAIVRQREELPYHLYDLIKKMSSTKTTLMKDYNDIFASTEKVIGGRFEYRIEEDDFVFLKPNGDKIHAINTANGVKSLGIIQLLLNSETINSQSILIIDEPEVHLHPSWEVEYADLVVQLSKMGIPIIVSSHSPYFLQSLTASIAKFDTQSISKFYYGRKIDKIESTIFEDVTDDMEPIWTALARPMTQVYNR